MATFGFTNDSAGSQNLGSGRKVLSLLSSGSVSGTLDSVIARVWKTDGTMIAKAIIYADSAGSPGALLATSDELSVALGTETEKHFVFSGAERISLSSSTSYWVGLHLGHASGNATMSVGATANALKWAVDTYSDGPADPCGAVNNLTGPLDVQVVTEETGPIKYRASSSNEGTTTTAVVNVPPGTDTGDIIFAAIHVGTNTGTPTIDTPDGWTSIAHQVGTAGVTSTVRVLWREWQSGETSYSITVSHSSGGWVANAASYSGVDTTSPVDDVDISTIAETGSTAAVSTPTLTSSTSNVWRLAIFHGLTTTADRAYGSYSPADLERQDNACTAATRRAHGSLVDSGGSVDASAGTSVSGTPSATTEDRTAALVLINPVSSGTPISDPDTGTGAEAEDIAVSSASDDEATATEAGDVAAALSEDDPSSATEGTPTIALTTDDTGSGTESENLVVSVSDADTATGVDAESISASLTDSDTSLGAETENLVASFTDTDTASGVDAEAVLIPVTDSDTATGAEAESTLANLNDADTYSGAEASSLNVTLSEADTGSAQDTEALSVAITDSDSAIGDEASTNAVTLSDTESSSSAESESLAVSLADGDTASAVDAGSLEASDVPVSDSDTGLANETEVVDASTVSDDSASAAEDQIISLSDGDTATAVEAETYEQGATDSEVVSTTEDYTLAVSLSDEELAAFVEESGILVQVFDGDSGSALDEEAYSVLISDSDTGSAVDEEALVVYILSDEGVTAVEVSELAVALSSLDDVVLTDDGVVTLPGTDLAFQIGRLTTGWSIEGPDTVNVNMVFIRAKWTLDHFTRSYE